MRPERRSSRWPTRSTPRPNDLLELIRRLSYHARMPRHAAPALVRHARRRRHGRAVEGSNTCAPRPRPTRRRCSNTPPGGVPADRLEQAVRPRRGPPAAALPARRRLVRPRRARRPPHGAVCAAASRRRPVTAAGRRRPPHPAWSGSVSRWPRSSRRFGVRTSPRPRTRPRSRVLTALRDAFGRLPVPLFEHCFELYRRVLESYCVVFQPVITLGKTARRVEVHSYEALARRSGLRLAGPGGDAAAGRGVGRPVRGSSATR